MSNASLIYKYPAVYELVMTVLYGRHYGARYEALSDLIPPGASVLDLCCGPAVLYRRYLSKKDINYTGLDISTAFVEFLNRKGVQVHLWDLRSTRALPKADFVIMQASLYHFLPDPSPVIERMLDAANKAVIVAEPIRNLADGKSLISTISKWATDPGYGPQARRFTEESLDRFFIDFSSVRDNFVIQGGREKVYVLDATKKASGKEYAGRVLARG